ncbi:hypothetical protein P692DRAFT_2073810 [Suillus brevipes Sb2]|nr:hypothetical protein P692DRAFT_2073810 [Suillus brevipes Sb2]
MQVSKARYHNSALVVKQRLCISTLARHWLARSTHGADICFSIVIKVAGYATGSSPYILHVYGCSKQSPNCCANGLSGQGHSERSYCRTLGRNPGS